MIEALATGAMAELRRFLSGRVLLAFDLDGTLAPIAARPEEAVVPDEVQQLLAVLCVRTPLAIITGRAVRDARRMLWFVPRYVIGNHGAEGVPGEESAVAGHAALCRRWCADVAAAHVRERIPGTLVEDKGYTLALHYRLTRDPAEARAQLLAVIEGLSPTPRIVEGKRVLNLVPPNARHKGEALRALIGHAGADRTIYVGDDVTDEDVFALRLPGVRTIRVEPDADSAADLFLKRQTDVPLFLRELARMMASTPIAPARYPLT
ncbi:MAG: trehalose-phosphatase [Casimicrobiaceae bacterium]